MKTRIHFAVFTMLLTLPSLFAGNFNIAVNDLQCLGVDSSTGLIISDRLRLELYKTGRFTVVERKAMKEILKEQGFQQSVCESEACVVQAGQLLGVQYMVDGSIGKLGRTYTLNCRVVDVATGKIRHSANQDCPCDIDEVLSRSAAELARSLALGMNSPGDSSVVRAPAASSPVPRKADAPMSVQSKKRLRIILGSALVAGAAAGILLNAGAQKNIDDAAAIAREYRESGVNDGFDAHSARYKEKYDAAESGLLLRNIAYGLGVAGALGLGITFAF